MSYPEHLHINGRLDDQKFRDEDILYRGFVSEEYDYAEKTIKTETIKFPDFSCNWNRYSFPEDIRYRKNGLDTDGCYSFSVITSRYDNIAKPVHDPLDDSERPNYAHTEIRAIRTTDLIDSLPDKNRKINSRAKKLAYRENIANNLNIEFMASA